MSRTIPRSLCKMEDEFDDHKSTGYGKDRQCKIQIYNNLTPRKEYLKGHYVTRKMLNTSGQIAKFQGLQGPHGWNLLFQGFASTLLGYHFVKRQFLVMNEAYFMAEWGYPDIWSEATWRRYLRVRNQLRRIKHVQTDTRVPYRIQQRYFI